MEMDVFGVMESPLLIEKLGQERVFGPLAWVKEQRQNLIDEFRDKSGMCEVRSWRTSVAAYGQSG